MTPHNSIGGGTFYGPVLQAGSIALTSPTAPSPALHSLPPSTSSFSGRDEELAALLALLDPAAVGRPRTAVVTGLPGVGKTELVVQTARHAVDRPDWFPGGVLYADMDGYDPARRRTAHDTLGGFLLALGVPGDNIPAASPDRARLYASCLHERAGLGLRTLVVVDNVSDMDQVKPLLAADAVNATLVTSRHRLDGVGRRLSLEVLTTEAAVGLMDRALRQECGPGDTRVVDAADEAVRVAEACGRLPLALRIVAAHLADIPQRPLSSIADDLADRRHRIDELAHGDIAVQAAFDLSYEYLAEDDATLFRLLAIHPGPDLSTEAVSRLAASEERVVARTLRSLLRAHLVETGSGYGRWRLHDLVRLYLLRRLTAECAEPEVAGASRRLVTFYLDTSEAAVARLRTGPADEAGRSRFTDRREALAWLDADYPNMAAIALEEPSAGVAFGGTLFAYMQMRRRHEEWLVMTAPVRGLEDTPYGERYHTLLLAQTGTALRAAGQQSEAIGILDEALERFRELGDALGEYMALTNRGNCLNDLGRHDEGIETHREAHEVSKRLNDPVREAQSLANLGVGLQKTGSPDDSREYLTRALAVLEGAGDIVARANALTNLAAAEWDGARPNAALDANASAIELYRTADDWDGEATALLNRNAYLLESDPGQAVELANRAIVLRRRLGNERETAPALLALAGALNAAGRGGEAAEPAMAAARIFARAEDHAGEASALEAQLVALGPEADAASVVPVLQRVVALNTELGKDAELAVQLPMLTMCLSEAEQPDAVARLLRTALTHARAAGDLASEAEALILLGMTLLRMDAAEEAIQHLRHALELCDAVGDDEPAELRAQAALSLGGALLGTSGHAEAVTVLLIAARGYRDLGEPMAGGHALAMLGEALATTGAFEAAAASYADAFAAYGEAGYEEGAAAAQEGFLHCVHRVEGLAELLFGAHDR
ncbi:tetratricopeptide repeat protein [Streptomyces sp. Ju416(a)]|uniref:tetratricopeptide repeat protein n=1 Tax=Streptomyces sp. Ju416(a) TaxID=3446591 RepID=UPI00403D6818